jgi:hypothetical protein
MRIKVNVDTSLAIRLGVEPVRGTVVVDVPIASLGDAERAWIAERAKPYAEADCDVSLALFVAPVTAESVASEVSRLVEYAAEQRMAEARASLAVCVGDPWYFKVPGCLHELRQILGADVEPQIAGIWAERAQDVEATIQRVLSGDVRWERTIGGFKGNYWLATEDGGAGAVPTSGPLRGWSEASQDERVIEVARAAVKRLNAEEEARRVARAQAEQEAEAAKARKAARREALVREWGSEAQRQRLAEGRMPSSEQDEIIDLRLAIPGCAVYPKLTIADIEHKEDCDARGARFTVVEDSTGEPVALDEAEYRRLKILRDAASETLAGWTHTLTVRRHEGTCSDCGEAVYRCGVRVWIDLGEGLTTSTEYTLGGE